MHLSCAEYTVITFSVIWEKIKKGAEQRPSSPRVWDSCSLKTTRLSLWRRKILSHYFMTASLFALKHQFILVSYFSLSICSVLPCTSKIFLLAFLTQDSINVDSNCCALDLSSPSASLLRCCREVTCWSGVFLPCRLPYTNNAWYRRGLSRRSTVGALHLTYLIWVGIKIIMDCEELHSLITGASV